MATWARLETGQNGMSVDVAWLIADALEIPIDELMLVAKHVGDASSRPRQGYRECFGCKGAK